MRIFLSYDGDDLKLFSIPRLVELLEREDDIKKVYYWNRDTQLGQTFDEYMVSNIKNSDLMIIFCSPNSQQSQPVQQEIGMAKMAQISLVPIYRHPTEIIESLKNFRGVKFSPYNFDLFFKELYQKITGKLPEKIDNKEDTKNILINFESSNLSDVKEFKLRKLADCLKKFKNIQDVRLGYYQNEFNKINTLPIDYYNVIINVLSENFLYGKDSGYLIKFATYKATRSNIQSFYLYIDENIMDSSRKGLLYRLKSEHNVEIIKVAGKQPQEIALEIMKGLS